MWIPIEKNGLCEYSAKNCKIHWTTVTKQEEQSRYIQFILEQSEHFQFITIGTQLHAYAVYFGIDLGPKKALR